jgi:spermidine synthase
MAEPENASDALSGANSFPPNRGVFADGWFTEENMGAARTGLRVRALLHEEQSEYQRIAVYDTAFFGKLLTIDDVIMLTERDEFVYHEMLIHVPLCAVPDPKQVLIIGGGDCGTLREALKHPGVERVVQCDIDERVTRVSEAHFPWVREAAGDPRAELIFDDGVRYIEEHRNTFDVIAIDSTDPVDHAAGLFRREFYGKVAAALRPGGVMTAQTESPHWEAHTVGAIYAEQRAAFTHATAYASWIPTYPSGWHFDEERAERLEPQCDYYNRALHRAAFALPTFARKAVESGKNRFERFDKDQAKWAPASKD